MAADDTNKPQDTPSFVKVIRDAFEARLVDLHTCMPAVIDSFDPSTGFAKVKPCLQRKYPGEDPVDLPVIPNVPVVFPRGAGGNAFLYFPLSSGDPVTLVFSERSLDAWKTTGGTGIDPADPRKHHLSDAFAIPGGYPKATPIPGANATDAILANGNAKVTLKGTGDVVIVNGTVTATLAASGDVKVDNGAMQFELTPAGKFKATAGGVELVATLVALMQDIQNGLTTTMLGPEPLVMPTFAVDLAKLQQFQG